MYFRQHVVITVLFFFGIIKINAENNIDRSKWEHPHVLARGNSIIIKDYANYESSGSGDSQLNCDINNKKLQYEALEIYYLKLVNYLLNENQMHLDKSSNTMKRVITLQLTQDDLKLLRNKRDDPQALDQLIFNVLQNSQEGMMARTIEEMFTIKEKIQYFIMDILPQEDIKFFTCITIFVIIIWVISRRVKKSFIITFILAIFVISYVIDYRRCCQEKQLKNLMELDNKSRNPCHITKPKTLLGQLKQFILGVDPNNDECVQHLMKNHNSLKTDNFCHPFEHMIEFVFYKNIAVFVEKMSHLFKKIISKESFPYNIIIAILFLYFCRDIVKYMFKYTFLSLVGYTTNPTRKRRRSSALEEDVRQPISNKKDDKIVINLNVTSTMPALPVLKKRNKAKRDLKYLKGSISAEIAQEEKIENLEEEAPLINEDDSIENEWIDLTSEETKVKSSIENINKLDK